MGLPNRNCLLQNILSCGPQEKTLFYRPNSLRVGGLSKLSCPSIVDEDDG